MLVLFFFIFMVISLGLTEAVTLIPIHLLEPGPLPSWVWWGLVAIALSWFMGD